MKIRNANSAYGDDVVFEGDTLDECLDDMVISIRACGYEPENDPLVEGIDYEIVDQGRVS